MGNLDAIFITILGENLVFLGILLITHSAIDCRIRDLLWLDGFASAPIFGGHLNFFGHYHMMYDH